MDKNKFKQEFYESIIEMAYVVQDSIGTNDLICLADCWNEFVSNVNKMDEIIYDYLEKNK